MALAYAPEKYGQALQSYANRLELSQLRTPNRAAFGSWTYQQQGNGMGFGDNSNSQYALLGLYAAAEAGAPGRAGRLLPPPPATGQAAQNPDGGWSYHSNEQEQPTGEYDMRGGVQPDHRRRPGIRIAPAARG